MQSLSDIKKFIDYDPDTGEFTWKLRDPSTKAGRIFNGRMASVGNKAGHLCKTHGYWLITVDGVGWRANRLAYYMMTGKQPPEAVDHINGIKSDNRWCNLRPASLAQNNINTKLRKNNVTGHKGVHYYANNSKPWHARIGINKKINSSWLLCYF